METKLTLRLNKNVIIRAKHYAQYHEISLSKLVETYLDSVTSQNTSELEITPFIESLSGVVNLPEGYDYRQEYPGYLNEKYK
jgi:hypothetical protein